MTKIALDLGKSDECYVPSYRSQYHCGWLRASALCYVFGLDKNQFLECMHQEDFPKPTRISRVICVWNVSEVAYWLKKNRKNRRAEDYLSRIENEIHIHEILDIPVLMKKATLARYLGITAPVMELLVKRKNGFPEGVMAFASVPQYCVCDVNDWMVSNQRENPRRLAVF